MVEYPNIVRLADVVDDDGKLTLSLSLQPGYSQSYLKKLIVSAVNRERLSRMRTGLHDTCELSPAPVADAPDGDNTSENQALALPPTDSYDVEKKIDYEKVMRCLKPAERTVVNLYLETNSFDSVAGMMNQPRQWVDSRWRSAILKMKSRYSPAMAAPTAIHSAHLM